VRVLLDESLPRHLARELVGHQVETVQGMGWPGTKNGALLDLAGGRFDVLVTADQNLEHQQGISTRPVGVVVVRARSNRMEHIRPLVPELLDAIEAVKPGHVMHVGRPTGRTGA
jgi:hypothetical protein